MGPWIETEVDLDRLITRVRLKGALVSEFKTNDMIFGVARYISEISRFNTHSPGDIIWMGAQSPTRDMVAGDEVAVEIEGIAGKRFLEEAQKTLRQAELAEHVGKQAGRGELGRIEIGYMSSSTISGALGRVLRDYHAKFPLVDPHLHRLDTPRQFEYLIEGRIDVGFIRPPERYPIGLSGLNLGGYSIVLALPEDHRLAHLSVIRCEALAEEKFILPNVEIEIGYGSYIQAIADHGRFSPNIAQRNSDYISAITLVGAGVGLAGVPSVFRRVVISGVRYCDIDLEIDAQIAFVHRRSEKSPAVANFIANARGLARAFGNDLVCGAEERGWASRAPDPALTD